MDVGGPAFEKNMLTEQYFVKESSAIVKSTFARISEDKETDIVIIPGDLTKNGEKESHKSFIKELKSIKNYYGTDVTSIHPFRSFSEGYDLFSKYERRFTDALESFKRYFEAAGELGAEFIVLHGSKGKSEISVEAYAERYLKLYETAVPRGCITVHENVVGYVGAQPEFMRKMNELLGDRFKMVLDIKQARRAGVDYREFIRIMEKSIAHIHLSDYIETKDCIVPSENGCFDFNELFSLLEGNNYRGKYIVEVYSDCFSEADEIMNSALYLQNILNSIKEGSM